METKYFFINYEKETADIRKLGDLIEESGWINNRTILVNCDPDYSSRTTQLLNHKLSHLNGNELFECIPLNIPYPNMAQVWDPDEKNYKLYIRYLMDWKKKNIDPTSQYLFISSDIANNSNFSRLKSMMRGEVIADYRIATPYLEYNSPIHPEYFIEMFNKELQGELLFQWENADNINYKDNAKR